MWSEWDCFYSPLRHFFWEHWRSVGGTGREENAANLAKSRHYESLLLHFVTYLLKRFSLPQTLIQIIYGCVCQAHSIQKGNKGKSTNYVTHFILSGVIRTFLLKLAPTVPFSVSWRPLSVFVSEHCCIPVFWEILEQDILFHVPHMSASKP